VLQIQKLSRGVYWEAATVDGNPSAIAVDAAGDVIKRMVVSNFTWKKGEATVAFLYNFLNVKDPATTVGTVRPIPMTRTQSKAFPESCESPGRVISSCRAAGRR
jgi:hypothetical protein